MAGREVRVDRAPGMQGHNWGTRHAELYAWAHCNQWDGDDELVGAVVRTGRDLAREHGLAERGFRLVWNCGDDAGYSVYHIHLHLLGGRAMTWPPG